MGKLRLLDLFSGAGGAGMGYHRAGFEVVGVDIEPQRRYPFRFIQADALEYVADHGHEYDIIHASPPCQAYTVAGVAQRAKGKEYPDLVGATRAALRSTGKPYVRENVVGAPLIDPIMLCGTMFNLLVVRHRLFEICPAVIHAPSACNHTRETVEMGRKPDPEKHYACVVGHFSGVGFARKAMGIDWMVRDELAQAIPPAFTQYIGKRLAEIVARRAVEKAA